MPRHLEIPAAPDVSEKLGLAKYQLDLQPDVLTVVALDETGNAATTVQLHGSKLDDDIDIKSVLRDPMGIARAKGSHAEAFGRWGKFEVPHGQGPVGKLTEGNAAMLQELQAVAGDLAQQAQASHEADPTKPHALMDGICFIAGIGCGFWPIGTLIFGPTCVGCAVYYFMN